jgi:hypothetical protein
MDPVGIEPTTSELKGLWYPPTTASTSNYVHKIVHSERTTVRRSPSFRTTADLRPRWRPQHLQVEVITG